MLFDLQGRRKTAIKAVYLGLAILMAGGLVLFGIGSSVQGGFLNSLTGSSSGAGALKKSANKAQKKVDQNPTDKAAYVSLIGARYNYAGASGFYNQTKGTYNAKGKAQLKLLTQAYAKYSTLTSTPDINAANYAVQAYVQLQDAKGAEKTQTYLAARQPNSANYLALMRFALAAGDSRIGNASMIKARELASKDQLAEVNSEIKSLNKLSAQQNAALSKQIQEQFAAQQKSSAAGGTSTSPFGGLTSGTTTGADGTQTTVTPSK